MAFRTHSGSPRWEGAQRILRRVRQVIRLVSASCQPLSARNSPLYPSTTMADLDEVVENP